MGPKLTPQACKRALLKRTSVLLSIRKRNLRVMNQAISVIRKPFLRLHAQDDVLIAIRPLSAETNSMMLDRQSA